MNNDEIYRKALSNIAANRQKARTLAIVKKNEINAKVPEMTMLNDEERLCGIELARLSASGADADKIDIATKQLKEISLKKAELLTRIGYSKDYDTVQYTCALCKDTGRVNGEMCACVHTEANRLRRESLSKVSPLSLCSFNMFSLLKYSDDKSAGNMSERGHMQCILEFCKSYAEDFSKNSGSLYMCGSAGLGKTHLALSIANVVLQSGYDVIYVSSQSLFDTLEKEHFQNGSNTLPSILSAELLILDDLGTEYLTPYIGSCLYDIINTRWNKKLPTIYTSNFVRTEELAKRYTEKIVSRLLGSCDTLHFVGDDIRLAAK